MPDDHVLPRLVLALVAGATASTAQGPYFTGLVPIAELDQVG